MSDGQKRIILIGAVLLLILICILGGTTAVYLAQQFLLTEPSIDRNHPSQEGLLITNIDLDSPAALAGLHRGNIILEVNGITTNRIQALQRIVQSHSSGDSLSATILNGDQTEELTITLDERGPYLGIGVMAASKQEPQLDQTPLASPISPTPFPEVPIPPEGPFDFSISWPVIRGIVEDSPAAVAGLDAGDVITNVDDTAVLTTDELIHALSQKTPGQKIKVTFRRGFQTLVLNITLDLHPDDPTRGYLGIELQPGGTAFPDQP